ncbi:tryptophanyl-tRNA synthetase [Neisseria gonorrhoeae]|uniref:Tryptophanyl-tRNA synthetase n=1 Tax=Neisseria gonorrhoeae TaxID=485 RepID=A0A378VW95_NEIGO|nr:tryptophanyl-tRNA synthetase [Neisseria gonorrhoeae]
MAAKINAELAELRERYNALTSNPSQIEEILQAGAQKARKEARELLDKVRDAVGIRPLK